MRRPGRAQADLGRPARTAALQLSEEETTRLFWLRHAVLGVGLSAVAITGFTLYALWGAHDDARTAILWIAGAAALLTCVVAVVARPLVRSRWRQPFFYAWSFGVIVTILVAAAADGGDRSPVNVLLFLPLVYAGLAYPPIAVLVTGLVVVSGYLVVGASDATAVTWPTALTALVMTLSTLMATRAAANRAVQRRQLQRLTSALVEQASHDPLTGCFNRRAFDDALETEVARAERYRRPLSILLIDVDRLKEINDNSGHAAGDVALRTVAQAMREVSRRSDVTARLGGDEFAVLATETTLDDALELALRLHDALRAEVHDVPVTVSIGVATMADGVTSGADLIRAADVALYDAKAAGRNRTAVASSRAARIPSPRRRDRIAT